MSAADPVARLRAVGVVLAEKRPAVLDAVIAFLEAFLKAAKLAPATGRVLAAPAALAAPGALTAAQVFEAARTRGVPSIGGVTGARRIFLASLGLDLTDSGIRAALIEMHQRGELHLARLRDISAARADLAARGLRVALIEESAISDGAALFHVVMVVVA